MPSRTVAALVALALLVLGVGFGGALMFSRAAPGGPGGDKPVASPTSTASALTPQAARTPSVGSAKPGADGGGEPAPTGVPPTPFRPEPTHTPVPTATWTPTASPTNTPSATPTDTPRPERTGGPVVAPNRHKGPRWVTLQAGHWRSENLPDELQHLAVHTGASAGGVQEVDINVAVARLVAQGLYERGYSVEVLDATVPQSYTTDLFLALHADGSFVRSVRGFKAVAPWGGAPASDAFVGFLYEEYGRATGLPTDAMTTPSMANYYAFNPVKYRHAIDPSVPAAILEMGFVTNALDRQTLATEQDRLAWGIANAVDRYFRSGAAGPTPSPYPSFTPSRTPTRTRTPTSTPTLSPTPTGTHTPTPSPTVPVATASASASPSRAASATRTPRLPTATRTPSPTSTPLTGTITTDGRWLPPMAPNGRSLPPPGSNAPPVLLSRSDDDPHGQFTPRVPNFVPHEWLQYYMPNLGRSVWVQGPAVPTVTPTASATPSVTVTPSVTATPPLSVTPTREATLTVTVTPEVGHKT